MRIPSEEDPMTRSRPWAAAGCTLALTLSVAACGGDDEPTAAASAPDASAPAADAPATYSSRTFDVPFAVQVPAWLPAEPSEEGPHFVTWESTSDDRKVRMLLPVSVYRPGEGAPTAPPGPAAYLPYLREQVEAGAVFTDEETLEVSGRSVTLVTAGSDRPIDGSLGCQADGMTAEDCFGLQPELLLRMAVIPLEDATLLTWSRAVVGAPGLDEQFADFDRMVASLDLR
jgi:hypothetical protein